MKKLILLAVLFFNVTVTVYSQDKEKDTIVNSEVAENLIRPRFPGAPGAFQKYIGYNMKSITKPMDIKVSFVVEMDGSLSNVQFLTYVREPLRGEITEAILKSPTWLPGSINGEPVRVSYTLPIIIK